VSWITHSIRNKILAVIGLGIAVLVASALYGFAAARSGLGAVSRVNDTLIAQAVETQALESTFKEQVQQWMSVLVRGHEAQSLEKSWKQFTFREREVRRAGEKLRDAVELPAARELLEKFLKSHQAMGEKYRAGLEEFKASNFDARKVDAMMKGIDLEPSDHLEELVKLMRDEAQSAVAGARSAATRGLAASLVVIGIATIVALIACGLLVMRTVVRPLAHAVDVVDRVAAGDLTVEVQSRSSDEIGRLLDGLRGMRDQLAAAVGVIRRAARGVGQASHQIASGYADLSARTEEQAASLEETSSSMHELASQVRRNSEHARSANEYAAGASATAGQGGRAMENVVGTMGDIAEASTRISDIAGLIDSIAFQTNILALNAAVEAARAGDQGRGFAVVASEVRALAQRSATAAKDVKHLIQSSVDRVGKGTQQVENAGRTIQEIVTSVQRVTDMMSQISTAGDQQLSGIEQVSDTVAQMDRVVQQNSALVAESAAAAASLADHATRLLASVAHFQLEEGQEPPRDPALPPPSAAARLVFSRQAALPEPTPTPKEQPT